MNFKGIVLGALSFLIIGVWHPIVIKGEYHLGRKACVPLFGAIGAACVALSMRVKNTMLNTAIALFGFSALWGIHEVAEQEQRVARGWFPANPKRTAVPQRPTATNSTAVGTPGDGEHKLYLIK